jgi:DNA-binding IscR family transcriptional regulator
MVRSGVLRSVRGSAGGVLLAKPPQEISLLDVVEACQGLITAQYCEGAGESNEVCCFHQAMLELHEVTIGILSKWTLEDMVRCPAYPEGDSHTCRMAFLGCEKHCSQQQKGLKKARR